MFRENCNCNMSILFGKSFVIALKLSLLHSVNDIIVTKWWSSGHFDDLVLCLSCLYPRHPDEQ